MKVATFPPGHFYSPIPDIAQIKAREIEIYPAKKPRTLPGLNLHEKQQLELMQTLSQYQQTQPWEDQPSPSMRYHFMNPAFGYGDAVILHSMIRHLVPERIIEIGSGYSSAVILDTNELFFHNKIECSFIEPFPKLLYSLMKKGDEKKSQVIEQPLQQVDIEAFRALKSNDILFIDSTHVSKLDSDVNKIIFQILPLLAKGVYIHFHDIFYPFEYPKEWTYQGLYWNEDYLVRAFLSYNTTFEIVFFSDFIYTFHPKDVRQYLPLMLKNSGGSFWIRKIK